LALLCGSGAGLPAFLPLLVCLVVEGRTNPPLPFPALSLSLLDLVSLGLGLEGGVYPAGNLPNQHRCQRDHPSRAA
jgi:hypothetical protein